MNEPAAAAALDALDDKCGTTHTAIIRSWRGAWSEFIPFFDYDARIRRVICRTNAIDSLNYRHLKADEVRGRVPNSQAAMECLYMVTRHWTLR